MYGSKNEHLSCISLRLRPVMMLLKIIGMPSAPIWTGALVRFLISNRRTSRPSSMSDDRVTCTGLSAGSVGARSAAASVCPDVGHDWTGFRAPAVSYFCHEPQL